MDTSCGKVAQLVTDILACSRPTKRSIYVTLAALYWARQGDQRSVRASAMHLIEVHNLLALFLADRELVCPGPASLADLLATAAASGLPIVLLAGGVECLDSLQISGGLHRIVLRGERGDRGQEPILWSKASQPLLVVYGGEVLLQDLHLWQDSSRHGIDAEALHVASNEAAVCCRNVSVRSKSDCGVCVSGGQLTMSNCRIHDCGGSGLVLFGGVARLQTTIVERNGRCGVHARGSRVEFVGDNRFTENDNSGIFFAADMRGKWGPGNVLTNNGRPAVRLLEGCSLDGWEHHGRSRRWPQSKDRLRAY